MKPVADSNCLVILSSLLVSHKPTIWHQWSQRVLLICVFMTVGYHYILMASSATCWSLGVDHCGCWLAVVLLPVVSEQKSRALSMYFLNMLVDQNSNPGDRPTNINQPTTRIDRNQIDQPNSRAESRHRWVTAGSPSDGDWQLGALCQDPDWKPQAAHSTWNVGFKCSWMVVKKLISDGQ